MRRKSLVAAANGPFRGPWISLEAGEWAITLPASGGFRVEVRNGDEEDAILGNEKLIVSGPAQVRAFVLDGAKNIFVQATLLSRA